MDKEVHFWRKEEFNRFRFRIKSDFYLSFFLFPQSPLILPTKRRPRTTLSGRITPRLIYKKKYKTNQTH